MVAAWRCATQVSSVKREARVRSESDASAQWLLSNGSSAKHLESWMLEQFIEVPSIRRDEHERICLMQVNKLHYDERVSARIKWCPLIRCSVVPAYAYELTFFPATDVQIDADANIELSVKAIEVHNGGVRMVCVSGVVAISGHAMTVRARRLMKLESALVECAWMSWWRRESRS